MTIATPPSDGPISVDAPDRQPTGLSAPIHHPARLSALRRLALLDTPAEQAFDRLTRLTTKILRAPVAILSLVDGDRSFFKSSVGLPELWASRREIPLSYSVCQHVVALNAPLIINDARGHPLVCDNQAVAELRIVAYMGVPLVTAEGHALGTFAVIDTIPREWTSDDVATLGDLAASAMTEIELRAETNQRLKVEQRLDLLEAVVGNATVAVLIAEADPARPADPRIVFVNDAYTRLTGFAADEIVGSIDQVLNRSETDRCQIDTIRTALATRKPACLEIFTHRKDGSAFWAELNIVPIADKAGRYSHWVVIQRDISARKTMEEALRDSEARTQMILEEMYRAKEAAEAANRAKSEFFSRMSHELRTPLNIILGFGQLLEREVLSATQRESAAQILKGGRHLLALINEVLDIARIEAGGAGMISPEEVNVGEVLRQVLGMIQPLGDRASVRFLPPQAGTCDQVVRADLQRLKQVLLNLLSNAIKYNRQEGTVAISCSETAGAMLRISITDTGAGIDPEKMHRVFVPFDRLEAERKGVEGSGLGLALSKGLVEAMQGKMGVESTVGMGSTFWVELPRIDKTSEPEGENPAMAVDPKESSVVAGTVLYIEDNPASFRLVERILKLRPQVRLLAAMQGRLGVDLARQHRPGVIFLDLHLPDLQGNEVLRQLCNDDATCDIPVIILSADATPHQVERLLAAGARRYLVKPLDVNEFLRIIDETLNKGEP